MNVFNKLQLFIDGFIEGWNEEAVKQKGKCLTKTSTIPQPCLESEENLNRNSEGIEPVISAYDPRIFFESFSPEVILSPFSDEDTF
jgi:hypothetical protein